MITLVFKQGALKKNIERVSCQADFSLGARASINILWSGPAAGAHRFHQPSAAVYEGRHMNGGQSRCWSNDEREYRRRYASGKE